MAIALRELSPIAGGQSVADPALDVPYMLTGEEDLITTLAYFEANVPAVYAGLPLRDYSFQHEGAGLWTITAHFRKREPQAVETTRWRIQTGGGSTKITQSKSTINRYVASGTAPDFKGAIGVTPDGIDGVEIRIPQFRFTGQRKVDIANITSAYIDAIYQATAKVNSNSQLVAFFGVAPITFPAGTLLLDDVQIDQQSEDYVDLTCAFIAEPNRTGLTVGDITGIAKDGHDYLWVRYREKEDTASKRMVKIPDSVHVERVYDRTSFAFLGL